MNIQYRIVTPTDCANITSITDTCINAEEAYRSYISDLCSQAGSTVVGVIAFCEEKPIGVALCLKGMELTGERTDFFQKIRADIGKDEIWSGCVVAVSERFQGMHIGSELQKRCLSVIHKHGGKHLLLEIWVHPDGAEPSKGSLKLAPSYTDYGIVPDFYNIPALADHVCQICGTPCRCGARIAVLHLVHQKGVIHEDTL